MLHHAIYLIAIFSLSQSAVLIKFSGIPPEALGFWRMLGASVLLLGLRSLKEASRDIITDILGNKKWILITGVFFYLHLWSYSYSAQTTSVAHCMILFALNPLFTAVGAKIAFNEPLEKNVAFSYLFALVGLYFLLRSRISLGMDSGSWHGEASALASGILYSVYALCSKQSRKKMNNWNFGVGIYFVCSLCFLLTTLTLKTPLSGYSNEGWLSIIGTILIPTLLGHSLFSYLMNYLNINWMSCGKLLEPTISAFAAFLVFREIVTTDTVLAFFFTSAAVLFLFFKGEISDNRFKILLRKK